MADHYGAEIRIWPWPADPARVRALSNWLGEHYGEIEAGDGATPRGAPLLTRERSELRIEVERPRRPDERPRQTGGRR